jgi:hypothetical protein
LEVVREARAAGDTTQKDPHLTTESVISVKDLPQENTDKETSTTQLF